MENKKIKCVIRTLSFGDVETEGIIENNILHVGSECINIKKIIDKYNIDVIKVHLTIGITPIIWLFDKENYPSATRHIMLYKNENNIYEPLMG